MSDTTVDTKQVSIHFDHADFEQGVSQTLASLNKLNQAVENSGNTSSDGFKNLSNQLSTVEKEVNHGILPAMDAMTNKFSFFGTMADQIIRNLASNIQNTFSRAIGAIFQFQGGMNEYELKMGSIQTIMNGTGESLDRVNEKLNELNTYSDRTIYSFKDMTENIGKFTNQGVKLDSAVAAIKGIANEAALSGSNAQQASHAMYNFSQALSSGSIKLIDWKSIENAQMATVGFKDNLLQTAEVLGTVKKQGNKYVTTTKNMQGKVSELFNAQKGFNNSLNHQWLTNDVLTQTLEFYATDIRELTEAEKAEYEAKLKAKGFTDEQIKGFEDLGVKAADAATEIKTFSMLVDTAMEAIGSGWAQTFEIIFGDFDEAKTLWTAINNKVLDPMISKFSDLRNNMLKTWKEDGGRTMLLQSFVNVLNTIASIITPISEAFHNIFGSIDASTLLQLTQQFSEFTYSLILTDEQMESLRSKAEGLFKVLKFLYDVISPYFKQIASLIIIMKVIGGLNLLLAGGLGLGSIFTILKMIIGLGIVSELLDIDKGIEYIYDSLTKTGSFLANIRDTVGYIFSGIFGFVFGTLQKLINLILKKLPENFTIKDVIDLIGRSIISGMLAIIRTIPKINWLEVINVTALISIALTIRKFVNFIKTTLQGLSAIPKIFKDIKSGNIFKGIINSVNQFSKALKRAALAELIKSVALLVLSFSLLIHTIANTDTASIAKAGLALAAIMGMILLFNKLLIMMSENISIKGLISLMLVFIMFAGIVILMTTQFLIFGAAIGLLTVILGDANKAFEAMMLPLTVMATYFMSALIGIATLTIALVFLGKLLPQIAAGALALISISASLLAFGLALAPIVAMGLAVAITLGIIITILSMLPTDKVIVAIAALTASLLVFTGVVALLVLISKMVNAINLLALSAMLIAFSASIAILAASMLLLQNLDLTNMIAFFGSFLVIISVLTVVFSIFGASAIAAIPVLITITGLILAFGVAFTISSLGMAAFSFGMSILVAAITTLIPTIQSLLEFIVSISDKAKNIAAISLSFMILGKSLFVLAGGMGVAALASAALGIALFGLGIGMSGVGIGMDIIAIGITKIGDSIAHSIYTVKTALEYGYTWGSEFVGNFADGAAANLSKIESVVSSVAGVIHDFLHHSTPDKGPLKDDDEWGFDCIVNFVKGMIKGIPFIGQASEANGEVVKEGFIEGVKGAGDVASSNILSELLSKVGSYIEAGKSSAAAFFSGFTSKADGEKKKVDLLASAKEKIANGKQNSLSSQEISALVDDANRKKKKRDFFSIEDFLGDGSKSDIEEDLKKQMEDAMDDIDIGATDATKSGKDKSSKTSDAELKKQAEAQKIHNKYVKLSNDLATEYTKTYGNLMKAMGDTNPQATATAAIEKLKDYMYQASITADMTEDELKEAAQNVEKQFVETYENIKKKTSEVFDGFKEFDKGFTSITPAKTILKNIEDQVNGVEDMEGLWQTLALRSGTDMDYLSELMEGGAEKLPELRSLVSMTNDEYNKYMSSIADRKTISERIANTAMVAKAFMLQRDEIIKTAKTQRAYKAAGKKMIDAWNEAYNSGAEHADLMCNSIAQNFEELAKQNGLTFEQLRDQITGTTLTTEEELEKQINAYTNLSSTVEKWKSTYMKSYDDVKKGLEGLSTDLSDIDLSYDEKKSGKHLYNNLYKRNKALGEWGRMLNDLASRGLDEKFLSNYAAQGLDSYKEVKGLHQLSDERLHQMNGMMQSIEQQSEAIAKKYGASIANKMVEGMDSSLVDAFKKYAITDKIDMEGLAKEVGVNLQYIGNQFSLSLASGIEENSDKIKTQVETLGTTVDTTASTFINAESGYDKTNNFMQGMINGINDNKDELVNSVQDISSIVAEVPYKEWEEGSPSRLTFDYAKWFVEGMTRGFVKYGSTALTAAEDMVSPIAENIKNALTATYRLLTGNGSFTPTITPVIKTNGEGLYTPTISPVINLSAVQNGIKTLGSMREISPLITNQSNIQVETPNRTRGVVDAINSNRYNDTRLISEITGLRNDVNTLNDKMGNLQVVMDSGPLVGAIAPKMDTELGTIYRRRNRG